MTMEEIIAKGLPMLGVELHPEAMGKFRKFHDFMVEKNKVMNLTGITEDAEAARLHYLDCCALLAAEDFKNKKVIDVGTGAGFPGVPLKIAEPTMDITLLDSLAKRINFLDEAVALTGLEGSPPSTPERRSLPQNTARPLILPPPVQSPDWMPYANCACPW